MVVVGKCRAERGGEDGSRQLHDEPGATLYSSCKEVDDVVCAVSADDVKNDKSSWTGVYIRDKAEANSKRKTANGTRRGRGSRSGTSLRCACGRVVDESNGRTDGRVPGGV